MDLSYKVHSFKFIDEKLTSRSTHFSMFFYCVVNTLGRKTNALKRKNTRKKTNSCLQRHLEIWGLSRHVL